MDEIDYNAPIDPWTFSIEGVQCSWKPEHPFLESDGSEDVDRIIKNIHIFLDIQWETKDGMFSVPPSGPHLMKSPASPYAVLYAILSIYGDEPDLISFSDNAPKWTDIDPIEPGTEESDIVN